MRSRITLFIITSFLMILSTVRGATLDVPGSFSTIQSAINAAVNGDTVLVAPGTYVENIDFLCKAITVKSQQGADVTIIDGGQPVNPQIGSVVLFQNGEDNASILEGFTITNGTGTWMVGSGWAGYMGGGIFCRKASSPVIRNNIITENKSIDPTTSSGGGGITCFYFSSPLIENNVIADNVANWGGGVEAAFDSSPIITGNVISCNEADVDGGGIYAWISASKITHNVIEGNKTGEDGGGIFTYQSSSKIQNNTIMNNSATYTGGIAMEYGSPIVKNNTISGNSAVKAAGGVSCYLQCTATIENNTIIYNSALKGGGVWVNDSSPSITRNVVASNTAIQYGGGIFSRLAAPSVYNNIIAWNTADEGGGLRSWESTFGVVNNLFYANTAQIGGGIDVWESSTLIMTNNTLIGNSADNGGAFACRENSYSKISDSILWDNDADTGKEIYIADSESPSTVDIDFSDLEGGQASVVVENTCTLNWGSNMINANPLFAAGESGFHYLSQDPCQPGTSNPCVDTGSGLAVNLGMDVYWTRTDGIGDSGTVDMGYHYGDFLFPSLQTDTFEIPQSTGGTANLLLLAGPEYANRNYIILGSISGTDPGTPLPGGNATLPLNLDIFTNLVLSLLNTPVFSNFMGTLDASGRTEAQFNTIGPFTGGAGLALHFAYALNSPWDFASIPVKIEIL